MKNPAINFFFLPLVIFKSLITLMGSKLIWHWVLLKC